MSLRVQQYTLEVLSSYVPASTYSVVAANGFLMGSSPVATVPIRNVAAASSFQLTASPVGGGDIEVRSATQLIISANAFGGSASKYVSATSAIRFSLAVTNGQVHVAAASSNVVFSAGSSQTIGAGPGVYSVAASNLITLYGSTVSFEAARIYVVSALTTLDMTSGQPGQGYPVPIGAALTLQAVSSQAAASGITFSSSATANKIANATATSTVTLGYTPSSGRDFHLAAATSMNLGSSQNSNNFWPVSGHGGFAIGGSVVAIAAATQVSSNIAFMQTAVATIALNPGGGVPGGNQSGISTVLLSSVSGEFPNSYAETTSGLIFVANGIDPMVRWNGLSGLADTVGVLAPTQAIALGGMTLGTITGYRTAYCRFIDTYGNYSNLSPMSNGVDFGHDGKIDNLVAGGSGATITSYGHGLTTGETVLFEGITSVPLSGAFVVTVIDQDNFSVSVPLGSGTWTPGGRWVLGIQTVVYGNVPISTESKVVRRQILRNLDGNAETLYVDIDTTDLTSVALSSTKCDEDLLAGLPVPLFNANETPFANRYGVPPSYKAVIAAHLGRIFAAGDVAYTKGNCSPLFGQPTIVGVGTNWTASMAGRIIYMDGATNSYEIASVDPVNQIITTTATVLDATGPFTSYSIRPAPGERKFVYYSEPALPEAWPPWNAISLPEDSDEITGLLVKGSFIYVLEQRHIYKFTFQSDPARDGFVFLTTQRGCINNRCYVQVEDTVYLLDEIGLYAFDGQVAAPISTPIQNIFQQISMGGLQVNWEADQRYWHAAHDPVRDTIRWFVTMAGFEYPRHAICYDYRRKRFWLEEYPFTVTASTVGTIGFRRSIAGSEARRVLCLGEGSTDVVDGGNALTGSVTSSGPLSITDSSAPFASNLAGAPVSIASGKGYGQQRRIVSNTSNTLRVDRPWLEWPDATSVYQIGGINWTWQSGWFRFVDEQEDNSRDVELIFQPLKAPSSVNMRMYFDHSDCPRTWGRSIDQDGVTIYDGQPEIIVDMRTRSGFAAHRLTGHRDPTALGDRYVSVEVTGVQARDVQRVYSVSINGVRQQ